MKGGRQFRVRRSSTSVSLAHRRAIRYLRPMDKNKPRALATRAIHAGESPRVYGAVAMPIFQTAMYVSGDEESYADIPYIRLNNTPNQRVLHQKLAALEGGEAALVTSSGMAAISTTLLALLGSGDHLLAQDCLYGGTHSLVHHDLPELGIGVGTFDARAPQELPDRVEPRTRVIYCEALSNPLLGVADLKGIAAFARDRGILSVVDSTFATPINCRPLELGFDVVIHSGTKYLNGHSDLVAGAVVARAELVDRIREKLNHFGGSLDPHACFLLHRGLKTLAVRVARQNQTAQRIAETLSAHEEVEAVNYPGLPGHPGHALAAEIFDGFGGMLSFELRGGLGAAEPFLRALSLPVVAPSLGGVESLVTIPAATSHRGVDPAERRRIGISDSLVRLSVGLEDPEDLIDDLRSALATCG